MDIYYARNGKEFAGSMPASDGTLWFFETASHRIANVTSHGVVREFQIPYPDVGPDKPLGPLIGPDGAIWLEYLANDEPPTQWLVRMTLSGAFSRAKDREAVGNANVPGGKIWAMNGDPYSPDYQSIGIQLPDGRIHRVAGHISGFLGCAGQDGSAWVALNGDEYRVKLSGSVHVYRGVFRDDDHQQFSGCVAKPDGSVWWAGNQPPEVIRVTLDGRAARFALKSTGGAEFGGDVLDMALGPDGAIWVAADNPESLARISSTGRITGYKLPIKSSGEISIAAGLKTLWLLGHDFIAVVHLDHD